MMMVWAAPFWPRKAVTGTLPALNQTHPNQTFEAALCPVRPGGGNGCFQPSNGCQSCPTGRYSVANLACESLPKPASAPSLRPSLAPPPNCRAESFRQNYGPASTVYLPTAFGRDPAAKRGWETGRREPTSLQVEPTCRLVLFVGYQTLSHLLALLQLSLAASRCEGIQKPLRLL